MRGESADDTSALTTYPIVLSLRPNVTNRVRVSCETVPEIQASEENPTDSRVEHFLQWVSQELPKQSETVISKIPVTVTLEGKLDHKVRNVGKWLTLCIQREGEGYRA